MARRHKRLMRASKAQPTVILRFTAADRREIWHKSVLEPEWNWAAKSTLFCATTVSLAAVVTRMREAQASITDGDAGKPVSTGPCSDLKHSPTGLCDLVDPQNQSTALYGASPNGRAATSAMSPRPQTPNRSSNACTPSAGSAREKRKPWASIGPSRDSHATCSSVSVASTTTVNPNERARLTMAETITQTLRSCGIALTNERSTLMLSTSNRFR